MNVKSVTDHKINDVMVDIYMPDQKIIIQLILGKDINFDKNSHGGTYYI